MRKIKLLALLSALVLILSTFVSCKDKEKDDTTSNGTESYVEKIEYTVCFDSNGGTPIPSTTVYRGSTLNPVDTPKRDDYVFTGWTCEGKEWLFGSGGDTVRSDVTLYANWVKLSSVFKCEEQDGEIAITKLINKEDYRSFVLPEKFNGMPVTRIDDEVFRGIAINIEDPLFSGLKSVTFPSTVRSIGRSAFENCSYFEIYFNGAITELGENAFYNCNTMIEIRLGDGLKEIPFRAFSNCSLQSIVIPDSVTHIGENAFEQSKYLVTAAIPKGAKVDDSAFRECTSLKTLFFKGSESDFASLEISGNNAPLKEAKVYYYADGDVTEENKFWKFDDNGTPTIIR